MGLSDWWMHHHHRGSSSSNSPTAAVAVNSPTRASTYLTKASDIDAECASATVHDNERDTAGLWHVAGSSKQKVMKRSKSERLAAAHQPKSRPAVLVHGSSHVAARGLFQQAFAAKFFPKLKRSQLRSGESAAEAAPLIAARDGADACDDAGSCRKSSRLRSLFSRSSGAAQSDVVDTTTASASAPASWLVSEALTSFEEQVRSAVASGGAGQFQLTSDGCGGAYFLQQDQSRFKKAAPLGIFKPRDEEYMAPKNPRGYVKENAVVGETEHPVNKGFRIGNGALRERAAYVLDEAYGGFSGVPVTSVMTLEVNGEAKEGSMQRFVPSECSAEDMGTLKFAIPEVHKIGILDVRLFNTDRHAGNILLASRADEQTFSMTPIDHGFCLPSYKHLDAATFDWLHWPQAQFPFTGAELDHIASLDAARDASMLRALGLEEECITTMRMSTAFLQLGADAGFSLCEIASCLQREGDFSTPSAFEELVANASAVVTAQQSGGDNVVVVDESSVAFMDALVAEVARASVELFAELPKKKVRSISCFS